MGATVPPTMNPERVGRIPHTAARGMKLLIISLKTYASYLGKAPVITRASFFCVGFSHTKLSSELFVGIRDWSRDLQELAEAWLLERGRSLRHLVAFMFSVSTIRCFGKNFVLFCLALRYQGNLFFRLVLKTS